MRRGEIWRYQPVLNRPGQSTLRLIVSAEGINDSPLPVVLGLHIVDTDPGGLLAVAVEPHGWATVLTIEVVLRSRLVEQVGAATDEAIDQVSAALRAAMDL